MGLKHANNECDIIYSTLLSKRTYGHQKRPKKGTKWTLSKISIFVVIFAFMTIGCKQITRNRYMEALVTTSKEVGVYRDVCTTEVLFTNWIKELTFYMSLTDFKSKNTDAIFVHAISTNQLNCTRCCTDDFTEFHTLIHRCKCTIGATAVRRFSKANVVFSQHVGILRTTRTEPNWPNPTELVLCFTRTSPINLLPKIGPKVDSFSFVVVTL